MSFKYTTRESLQEFINKRASLEVDRFNRPSKAFKVSGAHNYPSVDKEIKCILVLDMCKISSLKDIQFPEVIKCTPLFGYHNYIADADLKVIKLGYNKLTTLNSVVFPPKLTDLELQYNQITSLDGVMFPPGLTSLDLSHNQITSFAGMQFPLSLLNLKLEGNPIDVQTVSELKNPSPFVIREIVAAFPETGPHFQHMEEMKEQQFEQLRTMMSQLKPMIEERKQTVPAFSATTEQGEIHSVPFIPEKTVQWAIEHLSEGPLSGKCINMKLFYNSKQLDPSKTLTDSGIDENSNLFIQCDGPKGGRKKRSSKTRRCGRGRIHRQKSAKNR